MKGLAIFLLSTFAIFSPAHGGSYNPHTLSEADWQLEALDRQRGPALTADRNAPRYWESYNQWLCFPAHTVDILRVTVTYEGERKSMPQIDAELAGHLFQISIDADSEDNFDEITAAWREIAFNSKEVCIYAAFLQRLPNAGPLGSSLWIVQRLKSKNGEWIKHPLN